MDSSELKAMRSMTSAYRASGSRASIRSDQKIMPICAHDSLWAVVFGSWKGRPYAWCTRLISLCQG